VLPGAQARQQQARAARAGKGSSLASGLRMLARSRLFTKLTVCVMTVGARPLPRCSLPAHARGACACAAGARPCGGNTAAVCR